MIRGLWGKFFPPDQDPETPKIDATHHHGLINFGNTCYCNSVLQVLDFQVNFLTDSSGTLFLRALQRTRSGVSQTVKENRWLVNLVSRGSVQPASRQEEKTADQAH